MTMAMYTFEVASVTPRPVTTKFGSKNVYDVMDTDGKKYNYGFVDPSKAGVRPGVTISAYGEADRFGIKLDSKTVTIGTGDPSAVPTPSAPAAKPAYSGYGAQKVFPVPNTHGDTAIIRQNALTNAVATVADFVATRPTEEWPKLDQWTDMVITVAYKYAKFSSGQRELEALASLQHVGMEAAELKDAITSHLSTMEKTGTEE